MGGLADQRCCCIDEFDKIGNQYQFLLEAIGSLCVFEVGVERRLGTE